VKLRPDDTVSERQLVLALAHSGRRVALSQLVAWRKDGFLPPLARAGTGTSRSYYWREPDVLEQAQAVHDGLRRHGRADMVVVALWLRGFTVSLQQFRRAWQSCMRLRKAPSVRPAPPVAANGADFAQLLLQAMLGTAAAIQPDTNTRPALAMLERTAARLDIAGGRPAQARWFWQAAQMMTSTLAASDVVCQASDEEMLQAQQLLGKALAFIAESCEDETPAAVVHALGETLFLFILTMLRSGQDAVLDSALMRIEAVTRRARPQPEPLYARA
jgi:hypothetical protein